jgi:hypothetical protein
MRDRKRELSWENGKIRELDGPRHGWKANIKVDLKEMWI